MFKSNFRQIGFKIAIAYSLLFIISSLALFASVYLLFSHSIERKDRDLMQAKLKEYHEAYTHGGITAVAKTSNDPDNTHYLIRIVDENKRELFRYVPKHWDISSQRQIEKQLPKLSLTEPWYRIDSGNAEDEDIDVLIQKRDSLYFEVGFSTDERDDLLERIQQIFLLISLPILLLGISGGIYFSKRSLAPIRDLITVIQNIQSGDLKARAQETNSRDELDELSKLFNQMLNRIQDLIRNIRETTDNIAHDLRTPMTRFRAVAELALKENSSKQQLEAALSECLEDADEMLRLVNTILDISIINTGTIQLHRSPILVSELFERVKDLYEFVAEDKQIKLECSCPSTIEIDADKVRITQALANLVDNAIKYTKPNGKISLHALQDTKGIKVVVEDNGIGIPEDDLPRIWERHFRSETSRAENGLGLGLSLVKSIVQAHKASIEVHSTFGEGTQVAIHFPNDSLH